MGKPLRVLIIEDSEDDALLILAELKRGGYAPTLVRVDTAEAMSNALRNQEWDILLSDYSMPCFSGMDALKLLKKTGLNIPFIIVSGQIGEEVAVKAMRTGAHDYIMKHNLIRLVPAINRELQEAAIRRDKTLSEQALKDREILLEKSQEIAHVGSWELDLSKNQLVWSDEIYRIFGLYPQEFAATYEAFLEAVHPDDRTAVDMAYSNSLRDNKEIYEIEHRVICKHTGDIRYVYEKCEHVRDDSGRIVRSVGIVQDITERKRVDEERQVAVDLLKLINTPNELREMIKSVVHYLRNWIGIEAVGIRLRDGDDYPYYEILGFPEEFVLVENQLCQRDETGELVRDFEGNPYLECMCGNILQGRFDPGKPFFTPYGSFWTNCTTALLASTTEADRQARTRNRCNGEGYESVALIPLHSGGETLGLIQLNDKRKDRFTSEMIGLVERLGDNISAAIMEKWARKALQEALMWQETAVKAGNVGLWDWNLATNEVLYSTEWKNQIGYEQNEISNDFEEWKSRIHPDDIGQTLSEIQTSIFKCYQGFQVEFRLRHKDRSYRWILVHASIIKDETGRPIRVLGSQLDITDRKQAEVDLRESEARVQKKLASILSPIKDIEQLDLSDIIDVDAIQQMMDDFYDLTKVPVAIIDLDGKVLVGTGWQDICTKFHRIHPETQRNCIECDTILCKDVPSGTFKNYLCKNNLWDCVTPLMVSGRHIGNLFTGQFFFEGEKPDDSVFLAQAEKYGFDVEQYMAAVRQVPVWDRETIDVVFRFYARFANMITKLSHSSILLAKTLEEHKRAENALKKSEELYRSLFENMINGFALHEIILDKTGKPQDYRFLSINLAFEKLTGLKAEDIIGRTVLEVMPNTEKEWIETYGHVALTGETANFENYARELDKYFEITAYSTTPGQFAVIFSDITDRKRNEEDKRNFYRDTIKSITQGKLDLISLEEAKEFLDLAELESTVVSSADAQVTRHEIKKFSNLRGISDDRLSLFETAVGEAITNAIKHAKESRVYAGVRGEFVWVAVSDNGPGISALTLPSATLRRGFSTKTSMGMGYTIMMETTDEILLCTSPEGTTVVLLINTDVQKHDLTLDDFNDIWDENYDVLQ